MVRLFDAAARYADRLPHERTSGFLAHISRQQLPGESSSSDPRRDAVSILTAHAAKGLEWDVVCVAAVQEGTWPDLRPRGTLLDTEMLLDLTAGRAGTGPGTAARLAEERRLFYVAVTRARRRLLVTAVAGEEDQPSRFLDELDPVGGDRAAARPLHGTSLPDLVAELRSVVCDPDEHPADREAAAAQLSRLAEAGVRGASPE
jgi:superfamily I DNA/RNA helicase